MVQTYPQHTVHLAEEGTATGELRHQHVLLIEVGVARLGIQTVHAVAQVGEPYLAIAVNIQAGNLATNVLDQFRLLTV